MRIRSRFVLPFVLAALMASMMLAGPEIAVAAKATFKGTVTDAATGKPLGGAEVRLFRRVPNTASDPGPSGMWYWSGEQIGVATTAADGTWLLPDPLGDFFDDIPEGDYYVTFSKEGAYTNEAAYSAEAWDNLHYFDLNGTCFDPPTTFHVYDGADITGLDAALEMDGEVLVHAVDVNSKPLWDVTADVFNWSKIARQWWQQTACTTGKDGYARVAGGVPQGVYRMTFMESQRGGAQTVYGGGDDVLPSQYASLVPNDGADIVVRPGETTRITVMLGVAWSAHAMGEVVDSNGGPLSDVLVTSYRYDAYFKQWAQASSAITDVDGRYRIHQTPGIYRFEFRDMASTPYDTSDDVVKWYPGVATRTTATNVTMPADSLTILKTMVLAPKAPALDRIAGTNRYMTAIAASHESFKSGSCDTVVIATGVDYPDALSASGLVGACEASLLLTKPGELSGAALAEIKRLGADTAYVVGGTKAVSDSVVGQLKTAGLTVKRVSGRDRYATSVAVANEVARINKAPSTDVIVARGDVFADAVAASGVTSGHKCPVILTKPDALPSSVDYFLKNETPETCVILGGTAAVSTGVESTVKKICTGEQVVRVSGSNRYATSERFAQWCVKRGWANSDFIALANGGSFPDALTAGADVGRSGGCVLLTRTEQLEYEPRKYVRTYRAGLEGASVFGGQEALSSATLFEGGTAITQD